MSAKEILKAVNEQIQSRLELDEMVASLPPMTQAGTRFFIFYSGKTSKGKAFDLPLYEIKTMTLAKNDALAKLLTNQPSDKICWDNVALVTSFMTSNMMDAVYTLRIGDKNATTKEAREFPVYMEISKEDVFERLSIITNAIKAANLATLQTAAKFSLVGKHAKRGSKAVAKGLELEAGISL